MRNAPGLASRPGGERPLRRAVGGVMATATVVLGAAYMSTSAVAVPHAQTASAIHFSFRGYANNVRVVAPLIGPYQLGTARISGSGTLDGSSLQSQIADVNHPRYSRYPASSMHARVVGFSYHRAAHGTSTTLQLTIEITQTDAARCAAGDRGLLTLHESAHKLSNGHRSDYIVMGNWGGRCPGFVQGWTNDDGGARTSPHYGGPPHGGQWAIVTITP